MTNYQEAKTELKAIASQVKKQHPKDKPKINQIINDSCNWLEKAYNLTDNQKTLLQNFACTLQA